MKKHILYILLFSVVLASCRKSDGPLDVDLSTYNADNYTPDPVIDKWLTDSLNLPYNIQTVYRFERNLTDPVRNISPIELNRVLPIMQAVRNVFLKPYEKIAGTTFIKKLTPKQWVLYGSPSYNDNGSVTLGTADGGRRVVLYELNSMNFSSGNDVRRKMRTIHHEFTHIINQNVAIPPAFEQISKADYTTDWTGSGNTPALAKELGFISQYSRSSFGEDFAEMVAHLLVEGQVWFNNYTNTTNAAARADLLAKEKEVKDYFKTYFNVDFTELQAEIQKVLKVSYGVVEPGDVSQTLANWLSSNRINTITYDPAATHYTTYGNSAAFNTIYNNYKAALAASGNNLRSIQFIFTDASNMVFRIAFSQGTGTTVFNGDYNFGIKITNTVVNDIPTNTVVFTKTTPEGTGTTYNNGRINGIIGPFEQHILPYLTNRVFVADWLPATIPATSPQYRTFGGFYVSGTPANYFYGPIVLK